MKNLFVYAAKTALYLVLLTGIFTACSNSTGSDEEEQEPVGFRIKANNQTIIEQIGTQTLTGTISVESGSTTAFTVLFIDETGLEFTPDPDEHSIALSTSDTIITFANIDSDNEPFSFDIVAQSSGNGSFGLSMLHEGAAEFTRQNIPVEVTASSN